MSARCVNRQLLANLLASLNGDNMSVSALCVFFKILWHLKNDVSSNVWIQKACSRVTPIVSWALFLIIHGHIFVLFTIASYLYFFVLLYFFGSISALMLTLCACLKWEMGSDGEKNRPQYPSVKNNHQDFGIRIYTQTIWELTKLKGFKFNQAEFLIY